MEGFLPVLLGTDLNAYGMARAFHQEYGIKSLAVGEFGLMPTKNSRIVEVRTFKDFSHQEGFLKGLALVASEFGGKFKKLLLVACGDAYAKLIIKNKKQLQQNFVVTCIDEAVFEKLATKEAFYATCEQAGLDFPQTFIINRESSKASLPFGFPVALKPSNSVSWLDCSFEGKKKAFIIEDRAEFDKVLQRIYGSSYEGNMIVQEFVPGGDTNMRVLNCYVGANGKVRLMCLGQPLLEDKEPQTVGNYLAIANSFNPELCLKIKKFLEEINYVGFANFDMKFDPRDGKFKLFEINLRQGRSSYFVTGSGYNLAKYLVEDRILGKEAELCIANCEHLWLGVPRHLLIKRLDPNYKEYAKRLIKEKKVCTTLFYSKDLNLRRILNCARFYASYYRRVGR